MTVIYSHTINVDTFRSTACQVRVMNRFNPLVGSSFIIIKGKSGCGRVLTIAFSS